MLTNEENTTTTEERALPCFVRHPDAGGQCWQPATTEVYGLGFCEAHGLEARLGAGLEACHDAENFFNRLRNPEATPLPSGVRDALSVAISHVRDEYPGGEDYDQALQAAYPELPADTRGRLE